MKKKIVKGYLTNYDIKNFGKFSKEKHWALNGWTDVSVRKTNKDKDVFGKKVILPDFKPVKIILEY